MSAFVSHTSSLLTLIASHLHSYNIPSLLSAASPSPLSYSTLLLTPYLHSPLTFTPTLLHHSSFSLPLTPHSSLPPLSYTTSLLPHTLPSLPLSTFTHTTVQSTCNKTIRTSYVHAISHTHTHSYLYTNTVIPIPIHPHPTHSHSHPHSFTHTLTPTITLHHTTPHLLGGGGRDMPFNSHTQQTFTTTGHPFTHTWPITTVTGGETTPSCKECPHSEGFSEQRETRT